MVRFEVLTATSMKMAACWEAVPRSKEVNKICTGIPHLILLFVYEFRGASASEGNAPVLVLLIGSIKREH
jgi:hypothetical protein